MVDPHRIDDIVSVTALFLNADQFADSVAEVAVEKITAIVPLNFLNLDAVA
jgi:hypothetical protein